jgi:hypothetical protein
MLVPSFSSKGFLEADEIVQYSSELIDGPALVSAYDLHYKKITPPFHFPSLLFLDSGGYEASKDVDLSDFGEVEHQPVAWSKEMHDEIVAGWESSQPAVFISYDHPKERLPFVEQVDRAKSVASTHKDPLLEILIKPETEDQRFVQMRSLIDNVRLLEKFAVVGVTEKEIGGSIEERMRNIAKLRLALDRVGLQTPIHVFGSLDTVTTPLYFLAGADIFDGLTWLRFAYSDGMTVYKHNFSALKLGMGVRPYQVDGRIWSSNYHYLREMESEMKRYLAKRDIGSFAYHADVFGRALLNLEESLRD